MPDNSHHRSTRDAIQALHNALLSHLPTEQDKPAILSTNPRTWGNQHRVINIGPLLGSRRNPYSHHSGTIIHMPRNPHSSPPLEAGVRSMQAGQAIHFNATLGYKLPHGFWVGANGLGIAGQRSQLPVHCQQVWSGYNLLRREPLVDVIPSCQSSFSSTFLRLRAEPLIPRIQNLRAPCGTNDLATVDRLDFVLHTHIRTEAKRKAVSALVAKPVNTAQAKASG